MAHPELNPNDEFADFEIYPYTFATGPPPLSQPSGSYVRDAFKLGLELQKDVGVNPFNFGFIGSSDGHNSASPVDEDNYFGKLGNVDGSAELRIANEGSSRVLRSRFMSAAGLAGRMGRRKYKGINLSIFTEKRGFRNIRSQNQFAAICDYLHE